MKDDKNMYLHVMETIAIDMCFSFHAKSGGGQLHSKKPVITYTDYDIIRTLSRWTGGALSCDIPCAIYQDSSEMSVRAEDVIGNANATFKMSIPQSMLYTTLKQMMEEEEFTMQTQSFSVMNPNDGSRRYDLSPSFL